MDDAEGCGGGVITCWSSFPTLAILVRRLMVPARPCALRAALKRTSSTQMQVGEEEVGVEAESDWEYEYHETETESFFVTLDFTTHAPPNSRKRKHSDNNDTSGIRQRPSEAPTENTPAPVINDDTPAPGDDTPAPIDRTRAPTAKSNAPLPPKSVNSSPKRLQFLDIATSNPLVSYKREVYTCDWAAAIGTDIFLCGSRPAAPIAEALALSPLSPSAPAAVPILESAITAITAPNPLSSRPGYNILGLSSLRLVAKPAQLTARSTAIPTLPSSASAASAPTPAISIPAPPHIPALIPSSRPASQQNFLSRLSAIKASRGDTDTVPLTPSHVDFSRTPLPVPSLDALRSVPPTPRTSTPRASKRGPGRGRGRGSRGGRGGVANIEAGAEGEGGDDGNTEEPETPVGPKPRRKREGPGRWGSGRGRGSRTRGSSSARGRLWTWNGAAGAEGVGEELAEVVVDPRLKNLGVSVDGTIMTAADVGVDTRPSVGAADEARQSAENVPLPASPDSGGVGAISAEAITAQEVGE